MQFTPLCQRVGENTEIFSFTATQIAESRLSCLHERSFIRAFVILAPGHLLGLELRTRRSFSLMIFAGIGR